MATTSVRMMIHQTRQNCGAEHFFMSAKVAIKFCKLVANRQQNKCGAFLVLFFIALARLGVILICKFVPIDNEKYAGDGFKDVRPRQRYHDNTFT